VSDDVKSVVWVLGAGFSQSLGGPLLGTLLSEGSLADLQACYPARQFPALAAEYFADMPRIYKTGVARNFWTDPESCLDFLDAASQSQGTTPTTGFSSRAVNLRLAQLGQLMGRPLDAHASALTPTEGAMIHAVARRFVAAECCHRLG